MASEVRLPRLGQGMESGTIVKWLKAEGDRVEKGEPLFEVDTEKATQEVEAELGGVLLRIAVSSGEVPVGETVALIGEAGELVNEAPAPSETADSTQSDRSGTESALSTAASSAQDGMADFRIAISSARGKTRPKASPLARRKAREQGIDLRGLSGTGPDGRIVGDDVARAASGAAVGDTGGADPGAPGVDAPARVAEHAPVEETPAPAPAAPAVEEQSALRSDADETLAEDAEPAQPEALPLTTIRRTIARRLTAAWQLPVFQLTVSADMTSANELVAHSRALNPEVRVTLTDLLAKVCARALIRHGELNVQFTEDALLRFPAANIGIAVAAPQGLVVPVIAAAERLSLPEVAARRGELVARAREARLSPADLEGGTFTISNLGMYGVEQFTAVLNPPQAAILAVGATAERPVVRDGQIVVAPMLSLTLTVDHRAVDGGPAAEFLATVKAFLEDPALAL